MFSQDVATGEVSVDGKYATKGPSSSFDIKNIAPKEPLAPRQCYFWDMLETCTPEQKMMFLNETAITENFILVGYKDADGKDVFFDGGSRPGSGSDGSDRSNGSGGNRANSGSNLAAGCVGAIAAVVCVGLQLALL
jgi:carboxypeptidase D